MANEFGNLIARRSPLALLLILQGYGVLYKTQQDFKMFVNAFADDYPEVAKGVVTRIKENRDL